MEFSKEDRNGQGGAGGMRHGQYLHEFFFPHEAVGGGHDIPKDEDTSTCMTRSFFFLF